MGYVGKVTAGGSTHLVGSTLYGSCATAAATAAKVVTCADFTTLITGVTIHVKFTYANGVANPTLNVNSTGAKSIYRYGTTAPSTSAASSWQAGAVVSFTYDGSAWIQNDWLNNNDNNYDRAVVNRAVKAAAAVTAGQIIVGTSAGYKPAASGVTFDISYPILWASTAIDSGATKTNTYAYYTAVDLTKTKSGYAGTTYSTVYLVCSSLVGNTATVHSEIFRTTQPTSADGLYYIPLGLMYSTTACYFYPINKVFKYVDGKFQEVSFADVSSLKYKGAKMLLLGNSYNRGVGGDSESFTYTRSDGTTTTYGKGWGYYFQEASGCDAKIICQSGGDFVATGNTNSFYPGKTYSDIMDALSTEMTASERAEYKYVVVGGFYNDHSANNTTLYQNIDSFCTKCRTYFPNAKIWIIPLFCETGFGAAATATNFNTWNDRAAYNGCGTCSNTFSWFYGRSDLAAGDSIHLNDTGYAYCGRYMLAVLEGWDGDWKPNVGTGWSVATNVTTGTNFRYYRDGPYTYLYGVLSYTDSAATTKLGDITSAVFLPRVTIYFPAFVYNSTTASRYMAPACLTSGGQLRLIPCAHTLPASGDVYFSASWMYGM